MSAKKLSAFSILALIFVVLPVLLRYKLGVGLTYETSAILTTEYVMWVLVSTVLSIFFLYLLLKEKDEFFTSVLIILVSISSTYISHLYAFPKLLYVIPLGLFLYYFKNKFNKLELLFPFLAVFGIDFALLVGAYFVLTKKSKMIFYISTALATVIGFVFKIWIFVPAYNFGIFEAGDLLGINILLLILGTCGFFVMWSKRTKRALLLSLLVLVLSPFTPFLQIVSVLFLSYLCANLFQRLLHQEWEENSMKVLTIIALFGLVLASYTFFTSQIVDAQPNEDFFDILEYSQENYGAITVLSSNETAILLQNTKTTGTPFFEKLNNHREIEPILYQLQAQNISAVWADENFKAEIAKTPFALHLENKEIFRQVVSNEGVELLWINYALVNENLQTEQ